MTDTASPVSTPGGGSGADTVAPVNERTVNERTGDGRTGDDPAAPRALTSFEADGSAVFLSLCRSSGGDRQLAVDLTLDTFVALDRYLQDPAASVDRIQLLLEAHRRYLAHPRAADDYFEESRDRSAIGLAAGVDRWAPVMAAVRGLTSGERVAVNLRLIDGLPLDDIAELLGVSVSDVTARIDSASRSMAVTGATGPIDDIVRHGEMWLGDEEREDIRVMLGAADNRHADRPAGADEQRPLRSTLLTAAAVLVVAALAAAGTRWVQTLPDDEIAARERTEALVEPVIVARQSTQDGVTVDYTPIADAVGPTDVILLATGLAEPEIVVPDLLIRYSDGKVGLSWHGPCNRPAIAVAITNTTSGVAVELTTGSFPVLSCVGMPDRWSAVVEADEPLAEGEIRPVDATHRIVDDFDGAVEARAPSSAAEPISADAGYGSALVDGANLAWVYGRGCSSRSARYQSPIGAIYEIRIDTAAPDTYSASDEIVCNRLAERPVLVGTSGAVFPQQDAETGAEPEDCNGPIGSQTEVPSTKPYNTKFYDGDWSTWDGCLVRSDVIFSESLFETCAGADLRTITFASTIGERLTRNRDPVTFIRDPQGVIAGTRPPLLTYVIAPAELVDTGLRYRDQSLWLKPEGLEAIYVRIGETVERWPALTDEISCT